MISQEDLLQGRRPAGSGGGGWPDRSRATKPGHVLRGLWEVARAELRGYLRGAEVRRDRDLDAGRWALNRLTSATFALTVADDEPNLAAEATALFDAEYARAFPGKPAPKCPNCSEPYERYGYQRCCERTVIVSDDGSPFVTGYVEAPVDLDEVDPSGERSLSLWSVAARFDDLRALVRS